MRVRPIGRRAGRVTGSSQRVDRVPAPEVHTIRAAPTVVRVTTTPQPAHEVPGPEVHPTETASARPLIPGPAAAPDRETLARVLDGLRDLPDRPRGPRTPDPSSGDDAPAVPLPRRRTERRAPSVD